MLVMKVYFIWFRVFLNLFLRDFGMFFFVIYGFKEDYFVVWGIVIRVIVLLDKGLVC